jgi:hypothetical protein
MQKLGSLEHIHPLSSKQSELHPSPEDVPPSSHSSPASIMPFPQRSSMGVPCSSAEALIPEKVNMKMHVKIPLKRFINLNMITSLNTYLKRP